MGSMQFFHETENGPQPFSRGSFLSTTHSTSILGNIARSLLHGNASPIAIWGKQNSWKRLKNAMEDAHRFGADTSELWRFIEPDYSLTETACIHWYVEHARKKDFSLKVLAEFKQATAAGAKPKHKIVGHLPLKIIHEIMEGLSFEPQACSYPNRGRGGLSVGPVQVGLMFHASVLGVAPKSTMAMFRHKMPQSAINAVRRVFLWHYKPVYPEWNWGENANSAQPALLRPRDPRF